MRQTSTAVSSLPVFSLQSPLQRSEVDAGEESETLIMMGDSRREQVIERTLSFSFLSWCRKGSMYFMFFMQTINADCYQMVNLVFHLFIKCLLFYWLLNNRCIISVKFELLSWNSVYEVYWDIKQWKEVLILLTL